MVQPGNRFKMPGCNQGAPVRRMLLGLTNRCNMRCAYCYVPPGSRQMTRNEIQARLEWFLRTPGDQEKLVYLYGGEPLLARAAMAYAVTLGRKLAFSRGINLAFLVVTNGTLINRATAAFLREHGIKVMISVSSRERAHDAVRPFVNGRATYVRVLQGLEECLAVLARDRVWLNLTITPRDAGNLGDDVRFFERLGVKNFHLEPVIHSDFSWEDRIDILKNEVRAFLQRVAAQALAGERRLFYSLLCRQFEMFRGLYSPSEYVTYNDTRYYPGSGRMHNHFDLRPRTSGTPRYPVWDMLRQECGEAAAGMAARDRDGTYGTMALERAI